MPVRGRVRHRRPAPAALAGVRSGLKALEDLCPLQPPPSTNG